MNIRIALFDQWYYICASLQCKNNKNGWCEYWKEGKLFFVNIKSKIVTQYGWFVQFMETFNSYI